MNQDISRIRATHCISLQLLENHTHTHIRDTSREPFQFNVNLISSVVIHTEITLVNLQCCTLGLEKCRECLPSSLPPHLKNQRGGETLKCFSSYDVAAFRALSNPGLCIQEDCPTKVSDSSRTRSSQKMEFTIINHQKPSKNR